MSAQANATTDDVWQWLSEIPDPEVPAISIVDLGIVRDVRRELPGSESAVVVTITPTYSGCPAMDAIARAIETMLRERGITDVRLETRLSPPWTTDWMSPKGRAQLRDYGIAPPGERAAVIDFPALQRRLATAAAIECPHCRSTNTECISEFGSTSCKAQYRCRECLEPFDYFKPI